MAWGARAFLNPSRCPSVPTPLPAGLPHAQEDAGEEKALSQGVGRCAGQSVPRPCHGVKVPERLPLPAPTLLLRVAGMS